MKRIAAQLTLGLSVFSLLACSESAKSSKEVSASFEDLNKDGIMQPYENPQLSLDERVKDLTSRLTLDEKILLVTGTGFSLDAIGGSQKVPGAAGSTYAIARLGIPALTLADGPAGLRITPVRENDSATYFATAFPIATLLASSWDRELVQDVGKAMGNEVKEYGADVFLAPGMNIQLNPLAGRNFEYYSEDPLVSGRMAGAMVEGVQANGVATTIKHFVANNAETSRMVLDAQISERALREIYLRGFEIAVKESSPWGIMSSYNKVNGTYTSQSEPLLTQVLRSEWGYQGMVVTDWFSGDDSGLQIQAGNDLIMPGTQANRDQIRQALDDKRLSMAELDRNVRNILTLVFKSPVFSHYAFSNKPDLKAHAALARRAASEGMVLLRNQQASLPLSAQVKNIAAFGNSTYDFISGGSGSGDVNEAYTVSLLQGLTEAGLKVDQELMDSYQAFLTEKKAERQPPASIFDLVPPLPEMPLAIDEVKKLAQSTDMAIITLGRNSGEFHDRKVADDFNLSQQEQSLIDQVSEAFHAQNKKVVVILNIGNVVEVASWRDKVDAIVLAWQGGQEAGNAVVDVLTGKVNPSAKLAVSFPMSYAQLPSAQRFPGTPVADKPIMNPYVGMPSGLPSQMTYDEDIYVGYRYYDTFNQPVAYEFGYGLSYTSFAYSDAKLESASPQGKVKLSLQIKNTGALAGREVVEVYVSAPGAGETKPSKELKAFAKTKMLQPGETASLNFELSASDLASFDPAQRAWIAAAGDYSITLGQSSRQPDAVLGFNLPQNLVVDQVKAQLTPQVAFKALTPSKSN